jgi:glycosyltransferase involved in cell wall biosynthesis
MSRALPSVCFVAPQAYAVLARDRSIGVVGGAEVQQVTLARELVRRGHPVHMVCLDYGQPDGVVIDGITVHRAHAPDDGLPVLRFVHPRLTSLWAAMRRADADIYYQRNAGALTAFVAAFARRHRRRSIYACASDANFDPRLPQIALARDRALFRWGMRHVDAIVTQHPAQAQRCREVFGRDSTIVRSAYGHRGEAARHEGVVLWVGSIRAIKAPERFVDLARMCPQWRFRLVGGGDVTLTAALRERAAGLPNIEFTGFVPHADVESQFDGAAILVNTSVAEGFPNTFLQAWSRGMPTVSFFDPQVQHEGRAVGRSVETLEQMAAVVQAWKQDEAAWRQAGADCRAAFAATYDVAAAVDRYQALFERLDHGAAAARPLPSVQP